MKTVAEIVKGLIVDQLGVDPEDVVEGASLVKNLGADSLDLVELVMALEERFKIEIADEEAEKIKTVGDIIQKIEEIKGRKRN